MKTERYTYILREKSVKGADGKELLAGAADAAVGGMGLYVRDDDGSTTASNVITNTYEGPKGKLKVRKLMKLFKNGDKVTFPAVKFELTRSYTSLCGWNTEGRGGYRVCETGEDPFFRGRFRLPMRLPGRRRELRFLWNVSSTIWIFMRRTERTICTR